jgi:predicted RNA-binding protein YlqC (UPF0109 family)
VKELVTLLCRGLGVSEAEVRIERESEQDGEVTLEISAPAAVVRLLDGRDHRTAKAVRQVLSAAASARQKRYHLVARARD